MSDIYTTLAPILAGISALALSAVTYLWYRQKEVIALAKETVDLAVIIKTSNEDKNISEEEYNKIVQEINDVAIKLKDVIYKK